MPDRKRTFTPAEAAVVTAVPIEAVNRELAAGPIGRRLTKSGHKPGLQEEDLLYLTIARGLETRFVQLTTAGKDELYNAILTRCRNKRPAWSQFVVFEGHLSLDLKSVSKEVHSGWERLECARAMVVEDPEIRGGEACIRGTRIGVYEIVSMFKKGATDEEILEGYPSLTGEQLALAKIYAQAYPRKGRPYRHPWHQPPWREISPGTTHG